MSRVIVRVPGSCGELVQGSRDGKNFLITCPIDCYTDVTVELDVKDPAFMDNGSRPKAWLAVYKTLQHFGQTERTFRVTVSSMLPVGKGMASSSADISAACLATAVCLGKDLELKEVASIALSIEPTDAVFYPGIMMFDHRYGKICEPLGHPPAIELCIFDYGGEIDTVYFNSRTDLEEKNRQKEHIIREAVTLVRQGIAQADGSLIGKAATLSALANQSILPKPRLEEVIHCAQQHGAYGVNIAHSGTVIGVLVDPSTKGGREQLVMDMQHRFPQLTFLRQATLISGGAELLPNRSGS